MTDDVVARPGSRLGPFAVFGAVAAFSAIGALLEISYWIGVPAFSPAMIGTAVGIIVALVAFFAWGLSAPANE